MRKIRDREKLVCVCGCFPHCMFVLDHRSTEMLENKLSNLPSYIEALADIICNMSTVSLPQYY